MLLNCFDFASFYLLVFIEKGGVFETQNLLVLAKKGGVFYVNLLAKGVLLNSQNEHVPSIFLSSDTTGGESDRNCC